MGQCPEPKAKDLAQEGSDTDPWCMRSFGFASPMTIGGLSIMVA